MLLVVGLLVLVAATPLTLGTTFDEIWVNTEANETVLVQKWLTFEKNLKSVAESAVKHALPMLVRTGYDAEISQECIGGVLQLLSGIKDLKKFAIYMLDATGKPGGGQLDGSFGMFGSYTQCLRISNLRNKTLGDKIESNVIFNGRYCSITLRPPLAPRPEIFFKFRPLGSLDKAPFQTEFGKVMMKRSSLLYTMTHRLGVCVPSVCSREDVQKIASVIADKVGYHANVTSCEVRQDEIKLDEVQLTVFTICVLLVVITLCASILEYFLIKFSKMDKSSESLTLQIAQAWSLKRNMVKTFSPLKYDDDLLNCLHGVRFLSMGWVVLIHTFALVDPVIYRDALFADNFVGGFTSQIISNGGMSVDSFLFMTGLLVTYNVIKLQEKLGKVIFNVPLLLFKRIWRLLPSAMMVIGLITLLPLIHSGPMWNEEVGTLAKNCRERWWLVALFITNFFKYDKSPMVSLWYIAVDMQCFILALVFLGIYFKNRTWAYLFNAFLIFGSIISVAAVVYAFNLLPTVLTIAVDKGIMVRHFFYLHTLPNVHIGVYTIGMMVGVLLATKPKFKIPLVLEIIGWPVALGLMFAVTHATYIWNSGNIPTIADSILYGSLHRPVWALCLSWITVMCAKGRGGLLNDFLSWNVFGTLNRLTYLVYLVHVPVLTFFLGSIQGVIDTHHHMVIWGFLGSIVVSFGVAYIVRIFFEAPMIEMERLVLKIIFSNKTQINLKNDDVISNGNHFHEHTNGNGNGYHSKNVPKSNTHL